MTDHVTTGHDGSASDVTGRYYTPTFPIGQGKTDYEKYLRTSELLQLQTPREHWASPEEWLFQITHQTAELWMKLMLFELDRAMTFMAEEQIALACRSMAVVHDCQRLLLAQVDLIGRHLSIVEYAKIRQVLGQGSGMESPGFNWLLEKATPLWESFSALLQRHCLTLREIYVNYMMHPGWHALAEALMEYDDQFHKWRAAHFALVARTIGTDANSLKGLSTQVLQKGVKTRFFPELLALRSDLTNESNLAYGGQSFS